MGGSNERARRGSYEKALVNMARSFKLVMTSEAPNPLSDSEAIAEIALKNSACLKDWLYCCLCSPLCTRAK